MGKWLLQGCCEPCVQCADSQPWQDIAFTCQLFPHCSHTCLLFLGWRPSVVSHTLLCGQSWHVLTCAWRLMPKMLQLLTKVPPPHLILFDVPFLGGDQAYVCTSYERSSISLAFCLLLCLLFSQLQSLMLLEPGWWLSWSWSCLHIGCWLPWCCASSVFENTVWQVLGRSLPPKASMTLFWFSPSPSKKIKTLGSGTNAGFKCWRQNSCWQA